MQIFSHLISFVLQANTSCQQHQKSWKEFPFCSGRAGWREMCATRLEFHIDREMRNIFNIKKYSWRGCMSQRGSDPGSEIKFCESSSCAVANSSSVCLFMKHSSRRHLQFMKFRVAGCVVFILWRHEMNCSGENVSWRRWQREKRGWNWKFDKFCARNSDLIARDSSTVLWTQLSDPNRSILRNWGFYNLIAIFWDPPSTESRDYIPTSLNHIQKWQEKADRDVREKGKLKQEIN